MSMLASRRSGSANMYLYISLVLLFAYVASAKAGESQTDRWPAPIRAETVPIRPLEGRDLDAEVIRAQPPGPAVGAANGTLPAEPLPLAGITGPADWTYFSGDNPKTCTDICVTLYINPFSKESYGFEKTGTTTLTTFNDGAQSARTFGGSEKDTIIFDCRNSRTMSNGTMWFAGAMGRGKMTKTFPADKRWSPIPYFDIKLFAAMCSVDR